MNNWQIDINKKTATLNIDGESCLFILILSFKYIIAIL